MKISPTHHILKTIAFQKIQKKDILTFNYRKFNKFVSSTQLFFFKVTHILRVLRVNGGGR
jgi:hypothetical protein